MKSIIEIIFFSMLSQMALAQGVAIYDRMHNNEVFTTSNFVHQNRCANNVQDLIPYYSSVIPFRVHCTASFKGNEQDFLTPLITNVGEGYAIAWSPLNNNDDDLGKLTGNHNLRLMLGAGVSDVTDPAFDSDQFSINCRS